MAKLSESDQIIETLFIQAQDDSDLETRTIHVRRCHRFRSKAKPDTFLPPSGKEGDVFVLGYFSHSIQVKKWTHLHKRFSPQDFEEVWAFVTQQTLQRRQWIRELDKELQKAERYRTELVSKRHLLLGSTVAPESVLGTGS